MYFSIADTALYKKEANLKMSWGMSVNFFSMLSGFFIFYFFSFYFLGLDFRLEKKYYHLFPGSLSDIHYSKQLWLTSFPHYDF